MSVQIAMEVAREAIHSGLAGIHLDDDEIESVIRHSLYQPAYRSYL